MDHETRTKDGLLRAVRVTAVTLVCVGAVQFAAAQHGPRDPEARLAAMTEQLDLEDDQVLAVREILEDASAQARSLRSAQRSERRDAMAGLRSRTDAALAEVLTPVQMAELEAQRAARGDARREAMSERAEARFERLAGELELADGQREAVRSILEDARATGRDTMEAVRAGEVDPEDARASMDAMRERTRSELASVLTPAQLERFEAIAETHGPRGRRGRRGGYGPG